MQQHVSEFIFRGKHVFTAIFVVFLILASRSLEAQSCGNAIACENLLTGNLSSEWDVVGTGDPTIQGFATDISVNRGQTATFKISTTASSYRIDIYRLGYYAGRGARKVATINPNASLAQNQPQCLRDAATGLIDCGNWRAASSWVVPNNAVSGVYIARLVRGDNGGASHIFFIVRDDTGASDVLFQTSDLTWQAYNDYGGANLYGVAPANGPGPGGRAYMVSYNRPFVTRSLGRFEVSFLFWAEYPMIRWLEANGYNVSYAAGVDTDRRGSATLTSHKVFLSVGHDEYWSGNQRTNVEAARGAGVHLGFFSGNEIFWKTRWENSIDGSNTPYRTMVCYKETEASAKVDPSSSWTGTWRDPRYSPPSDGGRPENALTGQLYTVGSWRQDPIVISDIEGKLRFWRNTGLETLTAGQTALLPAGYLGIEWDEVVDNGFLPKGEILMSTTAFPVENYLQDYGVNYAPGRATHHLSLYRHSSGALVFGAGTMQWSWGLDATHDFRSDHLNPGADSRVQQATVNLLADMNVAPNTLQPGLIPAAPSANVFPPSSSVFGPTSLTIPAWQPMTVFGIATDLGGGRPALVEVSLDAGTTWSRVSNNANWSASFTAGAPGTLTIKTRATDDSGRIETPGPGISVTVTGNATRCTIWSPDATPAVIDQPDGSAVELGVRFKSDANGWITALRYYKSVANTGTHIGHLWTSAGVLLSTVTFTNETPSGWQEATLPAPVAITAGTRYVASYHTDVGHFSAETLYFSARGVDRVPLHAPVSTPSELNGLYLYGAGGFPTNSYQAGNYWIDVVFTAGLGPDVTAPLVTGVAPQATAADVSLYPTLTARFNEPMNAASFSTASFYLRTTQGSSVPASVSYDPTSSLATLQPGTPLVAGQSYTATVEGGSTGVTDQASNTLATDFNWTFTALAPPSGYFTIWPPEATPAVIDQPDSNAIELGVRFKADYDGWITALRYYKSAANTGTHVGKLWTNEGTLLASVTFTNETTGWQQAALATPVRVTAGTRYVASYHTDVGHFSAETLYFAGRSVDRGPLHAPADSVVEPNGVYVYGASAFPSNSYQSGNYWVDVVYTTSTQTATPSFLPGPGSYTSAQLVTIASATPGAALYFTTNGTTPTTASTSYTAPVLISSSLTLKAIAVASGFTNSPVTSGSYAIAGGQTAAPTFTPDGSSYSAGQTVSLDCPTSGAAIYYTTNGSTPTATSTRYSTPLSVAVNTTVKAIAVANASTSSVSTAVYSFQAAAPDFSPPAGSYVGPQSITLSDTSAGAAIYYTTNGSTPTTASTRYTTPFALTSSAMVKAMATATGWTNSSVSSSTYALLTIPDAPSGLVANAASDGEVNLSWNDVPTEAGFKIERKTGSTGSYAQIGATAANVLAYVDTTVTAGTSYSYRIRATNQAGDSPYSNEVNTTTPLSLQLPSPWVQGDIGSVGLAGSATFSSGAFTVKGAGADIWGTADAFRYVYQQVTGDFEIVTRVNSIQNTNAWAKAGLMIRESTGANAMNAAVFITPTNGLSFQWRSATGGNTASTAAPGVTAPYWLRLVRSGNTITGTASSNGLSWAQVGSATIAMNATARLGMAVTSHTTTALNQSVFSNVFVTQAPVAPSGLSASTFSTSRIDLAWTDNASNESGYKIERKTGAGGTYAQLTTVAANVSGYSDASLSDATTYYYRVRATNSGGDSAYTNEANATTVAITTPPPTPTGLTAAAISSRQIDLTWNDVPDEAGFKIERKTGAGGTYAQIATVGTNVTSYSNTGLAAGTTYYFRVRANNAIGNSGYSNEANAATTIATYRSSAAASARSGILSLTIDKPSGTSAGDVLVASVAIQQKNLNMTAPGGWTLARRLDNGSGSSNSLFVYYKVAGSSEPASYQWSFNKSNGTVGTVLAFSGVDTVNPVDVETGQNTSSGLSLTAPSVTTTQAVDMIVTSHAIASSTTFAPPSGMVEANEVASETAPNANGASIALNYAQQSAAGSTGPRTATAANNADTGNSHTLALRSK